MAQAAGEASVLTDVSRPKSEKPPASESLDWLAKPSSVSILDHSTMVPTSPQAPPERATVERPAQRGRFTNNTVRDDALVSWLASRQIALCTGSLTPKSLSARRNSRRTIGLRDQTTR